MTKLISGRIAKVTSANVSADRYQFIGLAETEPDLGLPAVSGYVLSSDLSGNRIWVDAAAASGSPYFANTSGIANVALTANIANTVLTLSNFTTANLVEGINLYYTNARVLSFITPYLTTANVIESASNLYYTNARVYAAITGNLATKANVTDLTTANVSELTNLYYTDARVYAAIAGNLATKANTTDLTTANVSELTNLYYTNARVVSAVLPYLTTSNVNEGSNLYYTNTRVNAFVQPYLTTANVSEVNNLYYTNARVRSTLSGDTGVLYDTANGVISIGQNVAITANVQFSNVKVTNIIATTGDFFISGNLIPSENAVFNFGSPTNVWKDFYLSAESLFVGNTKVSSNTSTGGLLVTTSTGTATDFTAANIFAGNAIISRLIYGNLIGTVSTLSNFTTANLAEGINLYYTNARVISAVTPYLTTANVLESNSNLYYTNARVISAVLPYLTTSNVAEGSNLYYTNARVYSNVTSLLAGNITIGNATIDNLLASSGNILITGNIIPSLDATFNFGSLDKQWKDFYLSAESLYVGGQKISGNAQTGLTLVSLTASNITTGNLVVTNSLIGNVTGTVSSLSNFTTSNLAEGTNQYFTNARVTANLSQQSVNIFSDVDTTGITTNGILIWNGASFVAGTIDSGTTANIALFALNANVANTVLSLSGLTTANLVESNVNLYFTNTRVVSALIAGQNVIIEANGRISANVDTANVTILLTNVADIALRVVNIENQTTSNLREGTNLYYTNTRVRSTLSGGTGVSFDVDTGAISIGQNVSATANVTFYNVSITNNLTVYGGVTTYGANNISVSDNMIYLNSNNTYSNPDIGFAFNYNDGVYRHGGFFRDASDNGTFKVFENYSPEPDANIFIDTAHASFRLANLAATTFFGNVVGTVSTLNNFTTANLAEGINLYYTNTRVVSAVLPYLTTSNVSEGSNLYYTDARVYAAIQGNLATKANVVDLTTANVSELTNLYYTNTRVYSNVIVLLPTLAGQNITIEANGRISATSGTVSLDGVTTSNLAEGSNLYYTNARVNSFIQGNLALKANVTDLTTANVAELTNLYYTNARVLSFVSSLLTTSNVAEGSNLYYTNARVNSFIQGNLATKANVSDLTSANVSELTNLYYTDARVYSAIQGNLALKANVTDLTTANVAELTNLYYTNARVNSFIQGNLATKANVTDLTTANVAELTNLYYTNARVYSNVIALLPTLAGSGIAIQANGQISANAATVTFASISQFLTTSNVSEGSNLYYTNARVYSNVITLLPTLAGSGIQIQANGQINANASATSEFASTSNVANTVLSLSNFTTANLVEGSNLYYTNDRVSSNVIGLLPSLAGQNINIEANGQIRATISLAGLSTTNLAEGSNLYYTNTRARTAFTAGKGIAILGDGTIKSTAAGGEYNINLTGATAYTVSNVMAGVTFTGGDADRFIVRSIQVTNISDSNLAYVSANVRYSAGNTAYLGNLITVPLGGFVEFISRTQILQAGDSLYFQGFNNNFTPTSNILSAYLTYENISNDTSYVGTGQTLSNANANILIVTADSTDFIFESIKFVNLKSINIPIQLYIANATTAVPKAYFAYNTQVPAGSSLEILQSPKVLKSNDAFYARYANSSNADSMAIFTSYRKADQTTVGSTTPSVSAANTAVILFNTSVQEGTVLYYTIE